MDLDIELDLNEVERRLGIPIEKLIRLAAKGKLRIGEMDRLFGLRQGAFYQIISEKRREA